MNRVACIMHILPLTLILALASGCSGSSTSIPDRAGGDDNNTGDSPTTSNGGTSAGGKGTGSTTVSPEGAALFADPESTDATPDSIYGLWGGVIKDSSFTFDTRMRISAGSITFATRCDHDGTSGAIAGVTARARVSNDEVAILESKKDERKLGDITCRANAAPGSSKRCDVVDGFQTECFAIDGTTLTFYGSSPYDKAELIKISD